MPPPKKPKLQPKNEEPEETAETAPAEEEIEPIDLSKVEKGTMVMCKYSTGMYYEAKVIDLIEKDGQKTFKVHYSGWNKRYDENITEAEAQERFKEHKTELAEHFKKVHKEQVTKSTRKSTVGGTPSEKADRESSRGSTPAARSTPRAASSLSTADAGTSGTPALKQPRRVTQTEQQPLRDITRQETAPAVMFTETLRKIISDDQDFVTRQKKLAVLPARFSVETIINEYIQTLGDTDEQSNVLVEYNDGVSLMHPTKSTLKENAIGLLNYFDASIGSLLLYKFERPQYSALYETEKKKLTPEQREKLENDRSLPQSRSIRMSKIYGFVHLLRMFIRLGEILSYTPWSTRSMETLMKHSQDLVIFLSKKAHDYHDATIDYKDTTAEYEKSVWAPHA